jgi:hypothetical protein
MSARNLFVLKSSNSIDAKKIYDTLNEYMKSNEFSVIFEPKGYWDEILSCLGCECNYFTTTENKYCIECEDIFSTVDSFAFARKFPRKLFRNKEYEYLWRKLSFFDDIILIVFEDPNVEAVEVYISNQYSTDLDSFDNCVQVTDGKLTEALISTYEPSKKEKYFGMKTVKFIVER